MDANSTSPITYRQASYDEIRVKVEEKEALEEHKRIVGPRSKAAKELQLKDRIGKYDGWFKHHRIRPVTNRLWRLPYARPEALWKPDLLHSMDLGMTKHSLEWMFNMLESIDSKKLASLYDVAWMAITPHPSVIVPKKKYRSVKQWSGKEYRNAAAIMLAVLESTVDPYEPKDEDDRKELEDSMDCLAALLNFNLMSQYKSHTFPVDVDFDNEYRAKWQGSERQPADGLDTISYLQTYLADFHNKKHTFLKYRASKATKRSANLHALAEHPSMDPDEFKKLSKRDQRLHLEEESTSRYESRLAFMEEHSHYNMPKVHAMVHFGETIRFFGVLGQYSTNIIERLHQPLNDAYNKSNKVDAMDQTLRHAGHRAVMTIRVANLIHLLESD